MQAKKKGNRRVAPVGSKTIKKVINRDLSLYGRTLRLPATASALSRTEISRDFRLIASLPPLAENDALNDPYLINDAKRLHPDLKSRLPGDPPEPEAAPLKEDEKASVIQALETAVFDDVERDSDDDAGKILEPSRVMSGWVAARLVAENTTRAVLSNKAPGLIAGATGNTLPRDTTKLATFAANSVFGLGSSKVTGAPLGMGPLRLELSLKERLAALEARREERDKKNLALRRHYVAQLRNYILESKENSVALEALRDNVASARVNARPNRSAAFASDEEEWAAVSDLASAAFAVWHQNVQLRERLAAATQRLSGFEAASSATSASSVTFLSKQQGGGAVGLPDTYLASGLKTPARSSAADENASKTSGKPELTAESFKSPVRAAALVTVPEAQRAGSSPLLCCGDLVATAYGRGVVIKQRDSDNITEVKLAWNAVVYMKTAEICLLAIAGEEFDGDVNDDVFYVQAGGVPTAGEQTILPSADDILLGNATVAPANPISANLPPALKGPAVLNAKPASKRGRPTEWELVDATLHGVSAAQVTMDIDDDADVAARAVKKIRTKSNIPINNRSCVFRSSWAHFGAPRGVPLRIDPGRGVQSTGFIVSSMDGVGDQSRVFVNTSGSFPFAGYQSFYRLPGQEGHPDLHRSASSGSLYPETTSTTPLHATRERQEHGENAADEHHLDSASKPGSSHGHNATQLQRYRAEVQRLTYQLRTAEDSRKEQRSRLTEMRQVLCRLLEHLNTVRSRVAAFDEDVQRKDAEVEDLQGRITRLYERFGSEAELKGWQGLQQKDREREGVSRVAVVADDESDEQPLNADAEEMLEFFNSSREAGKPGRGRASKPPVASGLQNGDASGGYRLDEQADEEVNDADDVDEEDEEDDDERQGQEYPTAAVNDPDLTQADDADDDAAAALGLFTQARNDTAEVAADLIGMGAGGTESDEGATNLEDTQESQWSKSGARNRNNSRSRSVKGKPADAKPGAKRGRDTLEQSDDDDDDGEGDLSDDSDAGAPGRSPTELTELMGVPLPSEVPGAHSRNKRTVSIRLTGPSGEVVEQTSHYKVTVFPIHAARRLNVVDT